MSHQAYALAVKKCPGPGVADLQISWNEEKTRIGFILGVLLAVPLQQTQMPRASVDV